MTARRSTRRDEKTLTVKAGLVCGCLVAAPMQISQSLAQTATSLPAVTVDAPKAKKAQRAVRQTARPVRVAQVRRPSARPQPQRAPAPVSGAAATSGATAAPSASGERADGPVSGYRASRSATGTKTDTALRDSPQSVQVIPREVIVDRQNLRLTDALTNVSGVQPAGTIQGRSDTFTLRGFNTQAYAIDGVYLSAVNTFQPVTRDLADIERIEVLKGPTSVLYGRGDPGGLINIVTRRPTFTPSADVSVQGGSFGFMRTQGSVSSAIAGSDTLAGRLSFAFQDDPTFRAYGGQHNQRYFVAPAVTWTPTPDTRIYVNGEFTKQYSQYDEGLVAFRGRVPTNDLSRYYGEPWSRYTGAANFINLRAEHDVNSQITLRQIVNYQGGNFSLFATRATGVNAAGTSVTRRDTTSASYYNSIDTQTEAIARFDTFGLKHTALVGFEYSNGYRAPYTTQGTIAPVNFAFPVFGALPGPTSFQSNIVQKLRMYGLYAQDQIELARGLQLVAGVRLDAVNQFYFNRTPTNVNPPPTADLLGVSPRVGLVFRPWEPVTFYASYTTSFTPQTANVLNVTAPPPETGVQYEAGVRVDLIPDKLTASTAVYQIKRNNVAATDPSNNGYSLITGQQQSRGVEFDIAGEILPGWKVIGGGAYMDARVTADTTFAIGNKLAAAPRWSGSIWSTYQLQDGPLKGLGAGAGVTYVGRRYGDLNNSYVVGQYARLDATIFYDSPHWRLAVNGRNLTNAHYIEQPFNPFNNMPGAPLAVLATLTAKY